MTADLIAGVTVVLMFAGVIFNQATVYTAKGWRYRVAVAAGLGGMFVVPIVAAIVLTTWYPRP